MIEVQINGVVQQLPAGTPLAELLAHLQLLDRRLAIECNLEVVPRSQFAARCLQDGDRLEIVHAIGGG